MNLLKKLLSLFIVFVIISGNILNVSAIDGSTYKELILSKNELSKTIKWKKYINQIDTLIDQYKDNEKILQKLESRLALLLPKLQIDSSLKGRELKNIVNYFYLKVRIALEEIEAFDLYIFEEEEEINYELTLSSEEQKIVNEELVKIQLNLLENTTKWLEILLDEFEKLSNYEEKGDFNMDFNFDQEQIWKINANFNFLDYIVKTSNFDSQISWDLDIKFDSQINWEENMNFDLSAFIDFISKDWNIYLLLKNLNISQENIDFIETQIEKIKEVAKENKYIKYDDENTRQALNILRTLTPSKILADWKSILSEPMFEAYKKEADKYYLKPTKYACDKVKETLNKFDPFNWSQCSEGQYEDMLEELSEIWEIYIILWDDTTLGFEWIKMRDIEELVWSITFSDKSVEKLYFSVIPNQNLYKDEFFKIDYTKNNNLDINLYAENWDIDYSFDSILDRNNKFTYINYKWETLSNYTDFISNFKLENRKMNWDFKIISKQYDWTLYNEISGIISWNTNYSNKIDNLSIEYIWDNTITWKFLEWSFVYKNNKFDFINNYYSEWFKSNFELGATWDSTNKIITDWKLLFEMFDKKWEYNYDTYEYIYSWDYEKNFGLNFDVVNKNIIWKLSVYEDWEELLTINSIWKYDKKYFELNNEVIVWKVLIEAFEDWYNYEANKYSDEKINIDNLMFNINMLFDTRYDKNNVNLYFDMIFDDDKILEFNLDNKADRDYKDIRINVPNKSDTIDFEEIIY